MTDKTLKYSLLLRRHLNLLAVLRNAGFVVTFDEHDDCTLHSEFADAQDFAYLSPGLGAGRVK